MVEFETWDYCDDSEPGDNMRKCDRKERAAQLSDPKHTVVHPTGVTIYHDPQHPHRTQSFYQLVDNYQDVFQHTGFVRNPPEQWAQVRLKDNWYT